MGKLSSIKIYSTIIQNMKAKFLIFFIPLFLFLIIMFYEMNIHLRDREQKFKALQEIKEMNGRIFTVVGGVYILNNETGKWELFIPHIRGRLPQDIVISSDKIICENEVHKGLISISFSNPNDFKNILYDESFLFSPICMSESGRYIACAQYLDSNEFQCLVVFDLENIEKIKYNNIKFATLSWSIDEKSIYTSDGNSINKLSIDTGMIEYITEGYWCKALPGDKIGFWRTLQRNEESYYTKACYIRDLKNGKEREVFRTEHTLLGSDWDPSGQFVIASASLLDHIFFIIPKPVCTPFVWDTNTGKRYILPNIEKNDGSPLKTGCIFWLDNTFTCYNGKYLE